jgi:hypothetical protein
MKKWNLRGVLGLLCVVALLGGMATPASAAPVRNKVSAFGWMYVLEDDVWDVKKEDDWGQFTRELSSDRPQDSFFHRLCAGNEARGELSIIVRQRKDKPGWVKVEVEARLFEGHGQPPVGGVACYFTDDLEGTKHVSFDLGPGQSMTKSLRVDNDERRSDDYMSTVFTVSND